MSGRAFRKFAEGGIVQLPALFQKINEAGVKAVAVGAGAGRMFVQPSGGAFEFVHARSADAEQYKNFF